MVYFPLSCITVAIIASAPDLHNIQTSPKKYKCFKCGVLKCEKSNFDCFLNSSFYKLKNKKTFIIRTVGKQVSEIQYDRHHCSHACLSHWLL